MDKEEIKNRLLQALQRCEYEADIRRLASATVGFAAVLSLSSG